MRLFDMSESQLDAAVQSHFDQMYADAFENGDDPCCENCRHYSEPICGILEDAMADEAVVQAEETGDWSSIEKEKDDYCDDFEWRED